MKDFKCSDEQKYFLTNKILEIFDETAEIPSILVYLYLVFSLLKFKEVLDISGRLKFQSLDNKNYFPCYINKPKYQKEKKKVLFFTTGYNIMY